MPEIVWFQVIQAVQPDIVMVELCKGRLSILQLDEQTLLEEAKELNMEKLRVSIKQVTGEIDWQIPIGLCMEACASSD